MWVHLVFPKKIFRWPVHHKQLILSVWRLMPNPVSSPCPTRRQGVYRWQCYFTNDFNELWEIISILICNFIFFSLFQVLMFACLPYSLGWLTVFISSSVYHLYLSRLLVGVSHALLTTTGNFDCGVLSSISFALNFK